MRLSLDVSLCSNEYTCSAYKRKGKGHPPNNGRDPQHMAADKRPGLAGGHQQGIGSLPSSGPISVRLLLSLNGDHVL